MEFEVDLLKFQNSGWILNVSDWSSTVNFRITILISFVQVKEVFIDSINLVVFYCIVSFLAYIQKQSASWFSIYNSQNHFLFSSIFFNQLIWFW